MVAKPTSGPKTCHELVLMNLKKNFNTSRQSINYRLGKFMGDTLWEGSMAQISVRYTDLKRISVGHNDSMHTDFQCLLIINVGQKLLTPVH